MKIKTTKLIKAIRVLSFHHKLIPYKTYKKSYICDIIKNNFSGYERLSQKDRIICKFLENNKTGIEEVKKIVLNHNKNEEKRKEYFLNAKNFYNSQEWREIRYEVLKEQKGICQLCGRSRKDGVVLHVDHIVPLSKDWSKRLDKNNLQILCEDCNLGKSNKDCIDWR